MELLRYIREQGNIDFWAFSSVLLDRFPLTVYETDICHISYDWIHYRAGGLFLEAPVITGSVKLFCFPFQMGVSEGLKIVQ